MDKIVINALKQENSQCKKEKEETEKLLSQYKHYKVCSHTRYVHTSFYHQFH